MPKFDQIILLAYDLAMTSLLMHMYINTRMQLKPRERKK